MPDAVADVVLGAVRRWWAAGAGEVGRPLVVGISGVQGAGKTTLTRALAAACHADGLVMVRPRTSYTTARRRAVRP
jgi:pantothenate kinase-related protein Tda10